MAPKKITPTPAAAATTTTTTTTTTPTPAATAPASTPAVETPAAAPAGVRKRRAAGTGSAPSSKRRNPTHSMVNNLLYPWLEGLLKHLSESTGVSLEQVRSSALSYRPVNNETGKRKQKVDPKKPKRPLSTFLLFQAVKRAEVAEAMRKETGAEPSATEVVRRLGAYWKLMAEPDKKYYQDIYIEQIAKYKKDIAEYKSKAGNTDEPETAA